MSERTRELRRRRKRLRSVSKIKSRAVKASATDKTVLAGKLRRLTPGADLIIEKLGLGKAK